MEMVNTLVNKVKIVVNIQRRTEYGQDQIKYGEQKDGYSRDQGEYGEGEGKYGPDHGELSKDLGGNSRDHSQYEHGEKIIMNNGENRLKKV
jgi:hypothetical protein